MHKLVIPRQPARLTTINAVEIKRQEKGVNICLGTACHGSNWSNWSVASCSQTGIYSLWLHIDFSSVCSLSRWLSLCNRCYSGWTLLLLSCTCTVHFPTQGFSHFSPVFVSIHSMPRDHLSWLRPWATVAPCDCSYCQSCDRKYTTLPGYRKQHVN